MPFQLIEAREVYWNSTIGIGFARITMPDVENVVDQAVQTSEGVFEDPIPLSVVQPLKDAARECATCPIRDTSLQGRDIGIGIKAGCGGFIPMTENFFSKQLQRGWQPNAFLSIAVNQATRPNAIVSPKLPCGFDILDIIRSTSSPQLKSSKL